MDPHDDDDDLLCLLLSYDCPVTGKKRTAGSYDAVGSPIQKKKVPWVQYVVYEASFKSEQFLRHRISSMLPQAQRD